MSVIGAGNFAQGVLLPKLRDLGNVEFRGVVTGAGVTAKRVAENYKFAFAGSGADDIWKDEGTNTVLVATRHNLHAPLSAEALKRGKHVFVEKPPALNEKELAMIEEAHRAAKTHLVVGFNRRFAPATARVMEHFNDVKTPLFITCRVNAGYVPRDHWVHDPVEGGGRIVGEACHFIDWILFAAKSRPSWIHATALPSAEGIPSDNVSITVGCRNGSVGALHYLACGPAELPKERMEIFGAGRYALLDDFTSVTLGGKDGLRTEKLSAQDKGHGEELRRFADAIVKGGTSPLPFEEAALSMRATFRALDSLASGERVPFEISPNEEEL